MLGGGKGGSDFDPKGKSDREVFRFCESFMTELHRHIGMMTDVPAGDIGVGAREIGYLYGTYKRLSNHGGEQAVLTGKNREFGRSLIRPEATGYGAVYFAKYMIEEIGKSTLSGKLCAVSGSGNVAQFGVEKLLHFGAVPVTMSDSKGCIYATAGITSELLEAVCKLKNEKRAPLSDLDLKPFGQAVTYHAGKKSWDVVTKIDCVFPCATQNEINDKEAQMLLDKGCMLISEGANMPSTNAAIELYLKKPDFLYGPGKAANAGGVSVSGLEMAQNMSFNPWTREVVDERLQRIMKDIFDACVQHATLYGFEKRNIVAGANIAGFLKVANAMIAQGQY